jgi:hypothetical protein
MTATMQGIPVHLSPLLPDGRMVLASAQHLYGGGDHPILWIGTAPLTDREQLRREARLTVRRGLADVLGWLGEAVENEPTGVELWDALKREGQR